MSTSKPETAAGQMVLLRKRGDLQVRALSAGQGWVLKDPIAERYFQLRPEEHFLWNLLNGRQTLESLCSAYAKRFSRKHLTDEELRKYLGQLVSQGLVLTDAAGSAAVTAGRRRTREAWQRFANATNLLAIRFRGVDPDRWLSRWLPWVSWLFSPATTVCVVLLILSALVMGLSQFELLRHRWPEEVANWSTLDFWSLALVLAGLKTCHELGHAFACKRAGCEVHEIGVLLLVLTPTLYCNVTDAWLLPSRWRRMVISAAGMWIESLLAALGFWVWWLSEPGWLHSACLQVIFVSSISTLLFNLNPLLRYDGYYLLSDLWEIPNLQQEAQAELRRRFGAVAGLRLAGTSPWSASTRRWLAAYGLASTGYRVLSIVVIVWLLHVWLEPLGYGTLAWTITGSVVLSLMTGLLMSLPKDWKRTDGGPEGGSQLIRPALLLIVVLIGMLLPLPSKVGASALVEPRDARGLFVTVAGRLESIVPAGSRVRQGDVIATLSNPVLERALARLEGELAGAQVLERSLSRRRLQDPQAQLQYPAALQTLHELEEQLRQAQGDIERLVIRAPRDGAVWAGPDRPETRLQGRLPDWSGSPFDARVLGCWLAAGTQLGWVGDAKEFTATAYVSQQEVARIRPGQSVRLQPLSATGRVFEGTVESVAAAQSTALAPEVAERLSLPHLMDGAQPRLVGTWYQVRITIGDATLTPVTRSVGPATITVDAESLGHRALRGLRETFPILRR